MAPLPPSPPMSVIIVLLCMFHLCLCSHPSAAVVGVESNPVGGRRRELAVASVVRKVLTLAVIKLDNIEERKQGKHGNKQNPATHGGTDSTIGPNYHYLSTGATPSASASYKQAVVGDGGKKGKGGRGGKKNKGGIGGGRHEGERRDGEDMLKELVRTTMELRGEVEKQRIANEKLAQQIMRNQKQPDKNYAGGGGGANKKGKITTRPTKTTTSYKTGKSYY
eukprot:GHVS01105395.1.p1 GENE.GHVS01105395.1~~GHVS01105395.1.p1  ORF type:complete len:245 (+),score=61.84 GHVS01105395.1:70-735(+)